MGHVIGRERKHWPSLFERGTVERTRMPSANLCSIQPKAHGHAWALVVIRSLLAKQITHAP